MKHITTAAECARVLSSIVAQSGDLVWFTKSGHRLSETMTASAMKHRRGSHGGGPFHGYDAAGVHRATVGRNGAIRYL